MSRSDIAQARVSAKWEIAVTVIAPDSVARPCDRVRVRRNVNVEIFEAKKIRTRGVADGAHAIDANAVKMLEPLRA
jgi:hypothetical protein